MTMSERQRFITIVERLLPIIESKKVLFEKETLSTVQLLHDKLTQHTLLQSELTPMITQIYGYIIDAMVSKRLQLKDDEAIAWSKFSNYIRMSDETKYAILNE